MHEASKKSASLTYLGADSRIEVSFTLKTVNGNQVVFAQGSSTTAATWEVLALNNTLRLGYCGKYATSGAVLMTGKRYELVSERKDGKVTLSLDGTVIGTVDATEVVSKVEGEGLLFFRRKSGSEWNNCPSSMLFHGARIYDGDELVAEYVPIAHKLFMAGVQETVSGECDASSAFGFDWNDRAATIDEHFISEGRAEEGHQVEWIATATGKELLQTACVPVSTDVIKMKVSLLGTGRHHTLFSAGGNGPSVGTQWNCMELLALSTGTWRPSVATGTGTAGGFWTVNTDYEIEYSLAGGLKVNGGSCGQFNSTTSAFTPTFGLAFFSRILQSTAGVIEQNSPASMRLYWAQVFDAQGVKKADFVPYVDGDGFAGLKDLVSGKVYLPLVGRCTASDGSTPKAVCVAADATGDDANAGTVRSPLKTLATALLLTPCGTVRLKDGTYQLASPLFVAEDNTKARAIEGLSGDASKVVIRSAANARCFVSRKQNGLSGAEYRNLTLVGNGGVGSTGAILYVENGTVENCVFEQGECAQNTTWSLMGGGAVYAKDSTLRRCIFRNNKATGEVPLGSAAYVEGSSAVESCLFEGNVCDGPAARACTAYVSSGEVRFRNCTFVKNRVLTGADDSTAGIRYDTSEGSVVNTVFCGNEHNMGASLKHSAIKDSGYLVKTSCASEYAINVNDRKIDATAFADWENGDYSPSATSRLISRGNAYLGESVTPSEYGTDLLGNPRFVGKCIDIGAYEWQGADPLPPGFSVIIR